MASGFSLSDLGEGFYEMVGNVGEFLGSVFGFITNNGANNLSLSIFLSLLAVVITIGTINWTVWIIRKTRSLFYIPYTGEYNATTSVVIPIYKEKKHILKETIDSILKHKPDEIILVFDSTEVDNYDMVQSHYKNQSTIQSHMINKPGKRPALRLGIEKSTKEIVIVVDSDTQWISKDFLKQILIPFQYKNVGGVGTRQKTREKKNVTHTIIDWCLDIKYTDYLTSDTLSGSVLCLSGRTAAYRRSILLPVLHKLEQDYFLGHKNMGGDDARLTTLVLQQGFDTVYQDTAVAQSDFSDDFNVYMNQKVRWSRNSFRTYFKSIFSAWPYKQRRWYYLMAAYHTIVPGLSLLLGIALFFYALYLQLYLFALVWFVWMFISRGIKSFSHLRKRPQDIRLLPVFVMFYCYLSLIKFYALMTLTKERWAGSRENYKIKGGKRVSFVVKEKTSKKERLREHPQRNFRETVPLVQ